jgi:hypothetical protein
MSVIYAMNYFLKILNVKDVNLYAALPVSIVFILLITTTVLYVDTEIII